MSVLRTPDNPLQNQEQNLRVGASALYVDRNAYSKKTEFAKHCHTVLKEIDTAQSLYHRHDAKFSRPFSDPAVNLNDLFPPKSEGKKWFNIGKPYVYKHEEGKSLDRATVLEIKLNAPLREWFHNTLIYEKYPPGTKQYERDYLEFNPCCKRESGVLTLAIPKASFVEFLFLSDNFHVTEGLAEVTSTMLGFEKVRLLPVDPGLKKFKHNSSTLL